MIALTAASSLLTQKRRPGRGSQPKLAEPLAAPARRPILTLFKKTP